MNLHEPVTFRICPESYWLRIDLNVVIIVGRLRPKWSSSSSICEEKWHQSETNLNYRKVSNISRTLVGNKIVDHSDVVGAAPVGAAPTTSSFST